VHGLPQRNELIAQVRAVLRSIQPRLPLTWPDGLLFQADLNLDSLDLVELVARIEQQYGLLIPDSDLQGFISLDAMADYLCARAAP
jgi:acyl carrier protein